MTVNFPPDDLIMDEQCLHEGPHPAHYWGGVSSLGFRVTLFCWGDLRGAGGGSVTAENGLPLADTPCPREEDR